MADHLAEKNIVPPVIVARKADDWGQHARRLHDSEVAEILAAGFHFQLHDDVEGFVEQLRKWMHRVNRQRSKDGADFAVIKPVEPFQIGLVELGGFEEADAVTLQAGGQLLAPAGVLVIDHAADALLNRAQSFGGGKPIGAGTEDAGFDLLLESGDADFKEFVEVGTGDAKEFEALEQRDGRVEGFFENALVEFQPAQFAIDVAQHSNE